jgi:hypothetical protein
MEIEKEAEKFAKKRNELDPVYANGLYYGFVECSKSNWYKSETIKARIEENESVAEMLTIYGTEASLSQLKKRIEQLQKQLKELENE